MKARAVWSKGAGQLLDSRTNQPAADNEVFPARAQKMWSRQRIGYDQKSGRRRVWKSRVALPSFASAATAMWSLVA